MNKIGFIGMGNMASALAKAFYTFAGIRPSDTYAYAPNRTKLENNAEKLGFIPCSNIKELVEKSGTVIMACKPYQIPDVLDEAGSLLDGKSILSVAAGWDIDTYKAHLDTSRTKVQYILPNTPVSVGEGIILMEKDSSFSEEERLEWKNILSTFSKVIELDKNLMDAGSAIAGCAPAFVDIFIEGLSDGGVKNGLSRETVYQIVPQMIIGAAKLMQETDLHPGQLKDMVCSPGGTTIKGVAAMEECRVRSALIKAVDAACGK